MTVINLVLLCAYDGEAVNVYFSEGGATGLDNLHISTVKLATEFT